MSENPFGVTEGPMSESPKVRPADQVLDFEAHNSPRLRHPSLSLREASAELSSGKGESYDVRRADLKPEVRSYADRLYARIKDICKKYGVSSVAELHAKVASGNKPKNLKPGELKADSTELFNLVAQLQGLLERKSLTLEEEFDEMKEKLYASERERLSEYFYQDFEIPPLPDAITKEQVEFWKKNGFILQFWPRIKMEEQSYPGRPHVLGNRFNTQKIGIEFYDELQKIKDLPENASNPNLQGLEVDELPGFWMLVDSRPKPNYLNSMQSYATDKMDDSLVQGVLKRLLKDGVLNHEASACLRNNIDPKVFSNPKFWEAFRHALKLDGIPGATVRLPRAIEANAMGQGPGWNGTSSDEWIEEYYRPETRMHSGHTINGGASYLNCFDLPNGLIGFRPLVVFRQDI